MKIAVVHSFYASDQPSGENGVVETQTAALQSAGHDVRLFAARTDDLQRSALYPLKSAATVTTGLGRSPMHGLRDFDPDIVHVHNLFPNFARRWIKSWKQPIVATLHNFRPLCASATLYRDGHVCTTCVERRNGLPAVRYGCYRGSRLQTIPLAMTTRFEKGPVLKHSSEIIALSDTMRDIYIDAGVDPTRVSVVPNFSPHRIAVGPGGDRWLYVGRLTEEKGIVSLLEQWPQDQPLTVVGDGPQSERARRVAPSSVEFLGQVDPDAVSNLMRSSAGLVFPSRWYEGAPLVYVEALAAGCPVLAWRPSTVAGSVVTDGTGTVGSNDLRQDLHLARDLFPSLRQHCGNIAATRYSKDAWLERTHDVYQRALATGA